MAGVSIQNVIFRLNGEVFFIGGVMIVRGCKSIHFDVVTEPLNGLL